MKKLILFVAVNLMSVATHYSEVFILETGVNIKVNQMSEPEEVCIEHQCEGEQN